MNRPHSALARLLALLPLCALGWHQNVSADTTHSDNEKSHQHHTELVSEEVLVTSPIHRTEAQTAHAVSVLDEKAIAREQANTLGEMLQNEPGVNMTSFGSNVGSPVIRGQTGNRASVLQNNISTQDVSGISPDHAIAVEPVLAERIEIIRGPATLLYGSGAIGGVVNVIDNRIPTQAINEWQGAIEARYDDVDDGTTTILKLENGIDIGSGNLAFHLDGTFNQHNDTDIPGLAARYPEDAEDLENRGRLFNSAGEKRSAAFGLSWIGENGYIGASVSRLEHEYGIPGHSHHHGEHEDHDDEHHEDHDDHDDHDDHEDEHHDDHEDEHHDEHGHGAGDEGVLIDMVQQRVDIKGEIRDIPLTDALRFAFSRSDYEHIEYEGGARGTRFDNESDQLRIEWAHAPVGRIHGAIGIQGEQREYSAIGEEAFVPKTDEDKLGLFIIEDIHLDPFTVELGLRVDRNELETDLIDRQFTAYSGSASLLWQIDNEQMFSVSLTHSERSPAIDELFANGPHLATESYEVGDPNLDKERSNNIELNYRYHGEQLQAEVSVYYNHIDNYIYQQQVGLYHPHEGEIVLFSGLGHHDDHEDEHHDDHHGHSGCHEGEECLPAYYFSQSDARIYGAEAAVNYQINPDLSVGWFGDIVRGKFKDGDNIPRMPAPRTGVSIEYATGGWSVWSRFTHVFDQNNPGAYETDTDSYQLLGAGVEYQFTTPNGFETTLYLKGSNLLDEEVRHATSFLKDTVPAAGRNLTVGIRSRF